MIQRTSSSHLLVIGEFAGCIQLATKLECACWLGYGGHHSGGIGRSDLFDQDINLFSIRMAL